MRGSLYKNPEKLKISDTQTFSKAHEAFCESLSEEEKTLLRFEHKVVMQVLGIKGMFAHQDDISEIEQSKQAVETSQNPQVVLMFF